MQSEPTLDRLQRWMLEVVTQPGDIDDALESKPASREIPAADLESVILPSKTLTSKERVDIYHRMYDYRMMEAMEFDYPGVEHFLGHHHFHHLVDDYIRAHPSRSYTLNRLGDRFPEYILTRDDLPKHKFIHDLASFELGISTVFDDPQSVSLTPEEVGAVPPEAWPFATFTMIGAFKLLELEYPADLYLDSVKGEAEQPPIRKSKRWMLLYRREYRVMQAPIDKRQWQLLKRLHAGMTLGDAINEVSRRYRPKLTETELFKWFRKWTEIGLFAGVTLPNE